MISHSRFCSAAILLQAYDCPSYSRARITGGGAAAGHVPDAALCRAGGDWPVRMDAAGVAQRRPVRHARPVPVSRLVWLRLLLLPVHRRAPDGGLSERGKTRRDARLA